MIDLSHVVDGYAESLTRYRYGAASWTNGVATYAAPVAAPIAGVLFPLDGRVLEQVPAGLRARAKSGLITSADVRTVDRSADQRPDELAYGGRTYQAITLGAWAMHGGFLELVLLELATE